MPESAALSLLTQEVDIPKNSYNEKKTSNVTSGEGKSPLRKTHGTTSSRLFWFAGLIQSNSQSSGSTQFSRRPTPYFKRKETWTKSEKDIVSIPSREEKTCLKEAGLVVVSVKRIRIYHTSE